MEEVVGVVREGGDLDGGDEEGEEESSLEDMEGGVVGCHCWRGLVWWFWFSLGVNQSALMRGSSVSDLVRLKSLW